jgi:CHAD domain-containing protein
MPGSNPIFRHWNSELKIFKKNIALLQQQLTADAIHDLRVAIKKLRSCFKLYMALLEKEDIRKFFSKTTELFSVLGKHRNIEISRQLLLSFAGKNKQSLHSLFVYLALLQDQISEYCQPMLRNHDIDDLNELTIELELGLKNLSPEETLNKTKNLVASSMENVRHNLKHFKEKSHLIRKDLKDVLYRARIFEEDLLFTKSQLEMIDKILDHLGNIQDHEVMITNIKNFRRTVLSKGSSEYSLIRDIESRAKKKKDTLVGKANKITHTLLHEL